MRSSRARRVRQTPSLKDADWSTLNGRAPSASEIDNAVHRLLAANDVKGLALALITDGHVRHFQGYRHRMVEKDLPMEPESIIYGASLTKATFAYIVMQLVDERAIDPDRSICLHNRMPSQPLERRRIGRLFFLMAIGQQQSQRAGRRNIPHSNRHRPHERRGQAILDAAQGRHRYMR